MVSNSFKGFRFLSETKHQCYSIHHSRKIKNDGGLLETPKTFMGTPGAPQGCLDLTATRTNPKTHFRTFVWSIGTFKKHLKPPPTSSKTTHIYTRSPKTFLRDP